MRKSVKQKHRDSIARALNLYLFAVALVGVSQSIVSVSIR